MTDINLVFQLRILLARLTDAGNNFGYKSAEYNDVIDEIHEFAYRIDRRPRRRDWIMIGMLIFVCLILCWIVYDILFYL